MEISPHPTVEEKKKKRDYYSRCFYLEFLLSLSCRLIRTSLYRSNLVEYMQMSDDLSATTYVIGWSNDVA